MPPAFLPPLSLPRHAPPRPSLSPHPPRASLTPSEPPSFPSPSFPSPAPTTPPPSPSPLVRDALDTPPSSSPLLVPRPTPHVYRSRDVTVALHLVSDLALTARAGVAVFALAATVSNLGSAPVQVVGTEWSVDAWRDGGGRRVLRGGVVVPVVAAGNEVVLRTAFSVRGGGGGVVGSVTGRVEIVCGDEGEDFFWVEVGDTYLTVGEER